MNEQAPRGIDRIWVSPRTARFRGGWLFDNRVRAALGGGDPALQSRAARLSDRLLWSLVVLPFVCATVLHPRLEPSSGWTRRVGLDAVALVMGVSITWCCKALAGRERPSVTARREAHAASEGMADFGHHPDHNASFLSGHALAAFTAASLSGLHAIYAAEPHGTLVIAGTTLAFAAATAAATLRIVADRHYATDTVAGALVGLILGGPAPWALYYRRGASGAAADAWRGGTTTSAAVSLLVGAVLGVAVGVLLVARFVRRRGGSD